MSSPLLRNPSLVYWLKNNLYFNLTNKCSNNCYFCLRRFTQGIKGFNLKLDKEPSVKQVLFELQKVLHKHNWQEFVFCGFGEPLERLDCIIEISKWIRKYYGKFTPLRINTNGQGYLLNKERNVILELKDAGIEKVSVSLNAHNKELYNQICKPKFENAFESVLDFINQAKQHLEVEISTLTIPEVSLSEMKSVAQKIEVPLRIRRYSPSYW